MATFARTHGTELTSFKAVVTHNTNVQKPGFLWIKTAGDLVIRGPNDGADETIPVAIGDVLPIGEGVLIKTGTTATASLLS